MTGGDLRPLRSFVHDFAGLLAAAPDEAAILSSGGELLRTLVSRDDWLPEACARPLTTYGQYLLHCDSLERFSVVSFVWAPGQGTPIHDHTVWGLVGQLRGAEIAEAFDRIDGRLTPGAATRLEPGQVAAVSPRIGDIHRVSNALTDAPSISIHVYGANIGAVERHGFTADGEVRRFVSGYVNDVTPNLWKP